ncbi:MAG: GH1 family beta-glucosidase [Bradymonadia bacterium]
MKYKFPNDFVWGVATSSFQIEGATQIDGRGPSIWDTMCDEAGRIADGTNGHIACDHYHRYEEDADIMANLGIPSYRFSVAWPRILPNGVGQVNESGLDFYDRLVDALLKRGIEPCMTLYHWDLPQALEDRGGWTERMIVDAFVNYTDVVTRRLGDRLGSIITHNEPWCISVLGYVNGEHAPGIKQDWNKALRCAHHLNVSHGMAMPVIRQNAPNALAGITINLCPNEPASDSDADREATRKFDGFFNRWYLDPIFRGTYPQDRIEDLVADGTLNEPSLDFVKPGDMDICKTPVDFLGINYYSRAVIRSDAVKDEENDPVLRVQDGPRTDMNWEVHPESLERLLVRLKDEYAPERIIITENGAAYPTGVSDDGKVHDQERIDYFRGHLVSCAKAIEQGVPLTGYYAWSLMDNFEWAFGYEKRFGLVHVDYDTLVRTPKESAKYYASVIAQNEVSDEE